MYRLVSPENISSNWLRATVGGGFCCLVLATCVFVSFEPVRIKLVQTPMSATSGSVDVGTSDPRTARLGTPFALIARVHHDSSEVQSFSIRVDGRTTCALAVKGGATRRLDCVVEAWARGTDHELVIDGPPSPWSLEYLELATHHGNVTGPLTAFVIPRGSAQHAGPGPALFALLALALAGLLWLPGAPSSSWAASIAFSVPTSLAMLLFTTLSVVPLLSPYRIVISVWTFVGWACLVRVQLFALWLWRRPLDVWNVCRLHHRRIALALSVATFLCGFACGSRALGASDTYGYVSEAELWLDGNLKIDQLFAMEPPWPQPALTFSPFGYRPDPRDERWLVPTYSPGLPMLMAVSKTLGGQDALFIVVPICAGLLVLATWQLGCRLRMPVVGLAAAWLVATSPVVLGHAMSAWSDVPAAAAWAGAFCLLLGEGLARAAGAGLLASLAIVIRPNMVPLVAVMCLYDVFGIRNAGTRRQALARVLVFAVASLPGALVVAAINQHLFGSPFVSGYGNLDELFAWSRVPTNLGRYLEWLIESHTPLVLLGLGAIFVPRRALWPHTDRLVFVVIGLFVATVWVIYCGWMVFDKWWFCRFLLPTWPFMMLGVATWAALLFRRDSLWGKRAAIVGLITLGAIQIRFADDQGVFNIARSEHRNVSVAQLLRQATVPRSVTLAKFHGGSLRYYGGRLTLNWAHLDGRWLERAVQWLGAHGVHTYAVLEDWEMPEFRAHFAESRGFAPLEAPPIATFIDPGKVMIFDLSNPPISSAKPMVAMGTAPGWHALAPLPLPHLAFTAP